MKKIKLTQGQYAIVDDADYEWLSQWNWCVARKHRVFYAVRGTERGYVKKTIQMHRQIIDAKNGEEVDHINGDGLDNRRANLRVCEHAENIRNQRKRICKKTSSFKGVSWDKTNKKWLAQIRTAGSSIKLGRFISEIEAAKKYDEKAIELFGRFANTNFRKDVI